MKKRLLSLSLLLSFAFVAALAAGSANEKPFVVPEVTGWQGGRGTFVPRITCRLVAGAGTEAVAQAMQTDAAALFADRPLPLPVVKGKAAAGDIRFSLKKDRHLGAEGYRIDIKPERVEVTAPTTQGLYWATRTLLQIMEQTPERTLPCGRLEDRPAYSMRGIMLDVGRKYIPLDYLEKLVRIMAYYKMNVLQVHLNDNGWTDFSGDSWQRTYGAFRLESSTYPGLAAADGHYTKSDFRDFQKHAAALGVMIIPEIDAPAHSLPFVHYWPNLASKDCGDDHLDIFNDSTYRFLDGLYDEYLAGDDPVFVGPYVHIGTDEYSNKTEELREKFRYFTDYYIRYVEKYGKRAAIWSSLKHAYGKTPVKSKDVLALLWSKDYADPEQMQKDGFDLLSIPDRYTYIVPAAGYYYDYLNTQYLYEHWTPRVTTTVELKGDVPQLKGGMYAIWNDHIGNGISVKDVHHRLFDALPTMATKHWTADAVTLPFADFRARCALLSEAPGVNERAVFNHGEPTCVLSQAHVKAGSTLPLVEVGYPYTVEFHLSGRAEKAGTPLFRSPSATLWLSDPVGGMLAFSRDGYLNKFDYSVAPNTEADVRIEGTNKWTRLYINGRLVSDLQPLALTMGKGKRTLYYQQTLVCPLGEVGTFNSSISNLKVYNYLKSK